MSPAARAQLEVGLRDRKLQEALRYWQRCEHPEHVTRIEYTVEIIESQSPGVDHAEANRINDAGDMVGRYFRPGEFGTGFLRTASGVLHPLDMNRPMSINQSGIIVGYNQVRAADGLEYLHAMMCRVVSCRVVPGASSALPWPTACGAALAINSENRIVGVTSQSGSIAAFDQGLLVDLTSANKLADIVMPTPCVLSTAPYGLNDAGYNPYLGGLVVGDFYDNAMTRQGFEFDDNGYRAVTRSGARAVHLRGVNNRREVVGFEVVPNPADQMHKKSISQGLLCRCGQPFSYSQLGDAATTLVDAPEFNGINQGSQIVGSFAGKRGVTRGFVATPKVS